MPPNYQPNYIETVQAQRQNHAMQSQHDSELNAMLDELKKMQMAALMGQSKPSVILTDQTDLGDKMDDQTNKLIEVISGLKGTNIDDMGIINTLRDGVDAIRQVHEQSGKNHDKHLKAIMTAVKGINLTPQVTVKTEPVDLNPLADMLNDNDEDEDVIDFDDYKASDLTNDGDKQYVGFLSTDGDWYIIENDIKNNTMRYVFGDGDYAKAFKKASTYKYKLLNDAVADYCAAHPDEVDEDENDDAEA